MITTAISTASALGQPCDACGQPLEGVHITDDEVCHGTDRPGYFLCGRAKCPATRAYAAGYSVHVRAAMYVRRPRPALPEPPPEPRPALPPDDRPRWVVDFEADLERLCVEHGVIFSHEDGHGSGLVRRDLAPGERHGCDIPVVEERRDVAVWRARRDRP